MNLINILKKSYIQTLVLLIVIIVTYGHTLDVPFYLDDFSSIQENPIIYNWQGTFFEIWNTYKLRVIGYLSFALNYQLHQFQVAGYHLVNIFIHFLAGLAVFGLVRGLIHTPALNNKLPQQATTWLPLIAALIFILHPLQIQAVTYIVQRLASLAAFFYIAAMASYIQARLNSQISKKLIWTLSCLLFALLAFFTKQNTATLPLSLLLIELIFFPTNIRRLILSIISAVIGIITLWFIVASAFNQDPFSLQAIQALTRETTNISRSAYFATQMNVLWTYIGLFFWPISSHIDYAYPISQGFFVANEHYPWVARIMHSAVFWALIGHLILLSLATYFLRKNPLIAFGIFFYYLAHSIESSFIPIRDVIFEHRTYLPNLALAILSAWLLVVQIPKNNYLTIIVILILGTATWQRNQMWRDPVALWQHNIQYAPEKKRSWTILGKHLIQQAKLQKQQGNIQKSHQTLKQAISALNNAITTIKNKNGTQSLQFTTETALNIIVAYKNLAQYQQALMWTNNVLALKHRLSAFDHAKFLVNQGNIYLELGKQKRQVAFYQQAEQSYRQALKLYPQSLIAQINLGGILAMTRRIKEAILAYEKVLAIDPSNRKVRKAVEGLRKLEQ